jgi:NAD(P)-dependent dehydrogenase (short-subunit alcohol dehydrogenase family)
MTKTWMITGSSRGFGRRLAEAVLEAGDNLVATARRTGSLKDLAEIYGDRFRAVTLDVTDPGAAKAAVETVAGEFGRLDVLVNNAGYANVDPIEDADPQDFRAQVETNLWGVIKATRRARRRSSSTSRVRTSLPCACCSARAHYARPARSPRTAAPKTRSGPPSPNRPTSTTPPANE